MRLLTLLACCAVLVTAVVAWTKEDHEIFDLVSAIEAAEGKGTTFYSWLDVSPTATSPEIARAYRKKSVQLHPDKNPGVKGAHDRFARLGVVSKILRDAEGRKRYDFFYKNGVPRWRGTGYYYSRFRPGLGTVLVFLTIVTAALQYLVQRINYQKDLKRIDEVVGQARSAAWGNKLTPVEGQQRKVKVNLGGRARVDEDGNVVPGRMVDMVVEGSNVFILESDGSMLPVDSSTAVVPSLQTTWPYLLASAVYARVTGKTSSADSGTSSDQEDGEESEYGSGTASDSPASGTVTPRERGPAASGGRAAATTMAGGRRRKQVRKK